MKRRETQHIDPISGKSREAEGTWRSLLEMQVNAALGTGVLGLGHRGPNN